jgi:non-homologous end joining protein Ku
MEGKMDTAGKDTPTILRMVADAMEGGQVIGVSMAYKLEDNIRLMVAARREDALVMAALLQHSAVREYKEAPVAPKKPARKKTAKKGGQDGHEG